MIVTRYCIVSMCQTLCQMNSHFFFTTLYIISIIFALILQVRRVNHGEVKQFSKEYIDIITPQPTLLTHTLVLLPRNLK